MSKSVDECQKCPNMSDVSKIVQKCQQYQKSSKVKKKLNQSFMGHLVLLKYITSARHETSSVTFRLSQGSRMGNILSQDGSTVADSLARELDRTRMKRR